MNLKRARCVNGQQTIALVAVTHVETGGGEENKEGGRARGGVGLK